jgi:hypothetical protein
MRRLASTYHRRGCASSSGAETARFNDLASDATMRADELEDDHIATNGSIGGASKLSA